MKKDLKDYFTPSEMAKFGGISKQSLLYYDRNNIFSPAYVDDNGYRYYHISQYFHLYILISLRKLDIPLKVIKSCLQNRTVTASILEETCNAYNTKITEYQKITATLLNKIALLKELQTIELNQVLLEHHPEEIIYLSKPISMHCTIKERITKLATHLHPLLETNKFTDPFFGFFYSQQCLSETVPCTEYRIFTISPDSTLTNNAAQLTYKKPGLYVTIYCHAYFGKIDRPIKEKILRFIKINNLEITSDIYVYPIKNFWQTNSTDKEIAKVTLGVRYLP